MLLQTLVPNDDVVEVTTTYGTNQSTDSSSGVLDLLFPLHEHPLPIGVLIVAALVTLAIVRARRTPREP